MICRSLSLPATPPLAVSFQAVVPVCWFSRMTGLSPEADARRLAAEAGDDPERDDRAEGEIEKARAYGRYQQLLFEHGRIDFMVNDGNVTDNTYRVESGMMHHTSVTFAPAGPLTAMGVRAVFTGMVASMTRRNRNWLDNRESLEYLSKVIGGGFPTRRRCAFCVAGRVWRRIGPGCPPGLQNQRRA